LKIKIQEIVESKTVSSDQARGIINAIKEKDWTEMPNNSNLEG
jgi:hypothetical protein